MASLLAGGLSQAPQLCSAKKHMICYSNFLMTERYVGQVAELSQVAEYAELKIVLELSGKIYLMRITFIFIVNSLFYHPYSSVSVPSFNCAWGIIHL